LIELALALDNPTALPKNSSACPAPVIPPGDAPHAPTSASE
jgi:hypothetical protein